VCLWGVSSDALNGLLNFILQAFQKIVHDKMQQMDFEPGADTDQAWHEMDLRQNSMLLSVTKELPTFEPEGVRKSDIDPKYKVFPKDRWFKRFPDYDSGSSPNDRKRSVPGADKVAMPCQPFPLPAGDGEVMIIAESILQVFLSLQTRAALNHRRILNF
jgi:hypothetical protein